MPTKKGALCTSIKDMVGTFNEPVLMGEFSGSIAAEKFFSSSSTFCHRDDYVFVLA